MSNLVINSRTYENIDFLRAFNSDGDVAHAPIIAETDEGITLLKYLDTTGNGTVDLGRKLTYPSTGSSLRMKFGILDASKTQIIFSSGTVGSSTNYGDQLVILNSKLRMDREWGTTGRFLVSVGDDIEYNSFSKANDYGSYSFGCNLTTGGSFGGGENASLHDIASPAHNMILFAEYKNSTYQNFATIRFYEFCYKERGVDAIHLYPAIDSNGVKCLYDSVSKTCLYSTNGAFAS